MLSLRQLEALLWTVRLKTLSRAAQRLNIAQPTISKRIQELEAACGYEVFRKIGRSVDLTPRGEALYTLAEQIFTLVEQADEIRAMEDSPRRKVGIGVTELTAHTWLPRLVNLLADRYPTIDPHVSVDHSVMLLKKLQSGELDLIVCAAVASDSSLVDLSVADVRFSLMGSPRLCNAEQVYRGPDLSRLPFLTHGRRSGAIDALRNWMSDVGAEPEHVIEVDSVAAQVGMALASMGVTLLPHEVFRSLLDSGQLIELKTAVAVPVVQYRVVYRRHDRGSLIERLAHAVRDACDFSTRNHI
jgi:DNA-binding transcriptional LysR family regulator